MMSFQKKLIFLDGRRYHKIEIIEYPEDNDDDENNCKEKKRQKQQWEEEEKEKYLMGKSYFTDNVTNNNIKSATDTCIDIICEHNRIGKEHFNDCQKKSFYCPIHENPDFSNSKSAQLLIKKNLYICYSSHCTLPVNNNGYRVVSTAKFLRLYKK